MMEDGRYRLDTVNHLIGDDGRAQDLEREIYGLSDGNVVVMDRITHTWLRREEQFDLGGMVTLMTCLGRSQAQMRPVPLSQQLMKGVEKEFSIEPDGTVRLTAIVTLLGFGPSILDVSLDPEKGYAPGRWAIRDPVFTVGYNECRVTEWQKFQGWWLPVCFVSEYRFIALSDEEMKPVLAALREKGLSKPGDWSLDRLDRLKLAREGVKEGLQGRPVPVSPRGDSPFDTRVTYVALNASVVLPPPPSRASLRPDFKGFDDMTGEEFGPGVLPVPMV
ncbi:MAG: hypothetical protein K2Q09_11905, partial [Phycisphaerales bacterium]|nr:hypothetical protein [Phycisphaerales bacterium]